MGLAVRVSFPYRDFRPSDGLGSLPLSEWRVILEQSRYLDVRGAGRRRKIVSDGVIEEASSQRFSACILVMRAYGIADW